MDESYLIAEYSTVVGTALEKGVSELKKSKKDNKSYPSMDSRVYERWKLHALAGSCCKCVPEM